MGFIFVMCFPEVSLTNNTGEIDVQISVKGQIKLDSNKIEQVREFHRHLFEDVFLLFLKVPTEKFDDGRKDIH
jgi:hypothetical protein